MTNDAHKPLQIQILISGAGTNAINIAQEAQQGCLQGLVQISQVLSNNPSAKGLSSARQMGISTTCIDHKLANSRAEFEQSLITAIESAPCDLLILAGFMRILSPAFVQHFAGKIINIHPSLLPAYKGLNTHQRALDANEAHHGVSVHLVIPDLDAGPIIGQAQLNIHPTDTAESLQKRIQSMEYWLYPHCLAFIASGQVQLNADTITLNLAQSTRMQQANINDQTIAQCHETGMIICTEEMILATKAT